jgi:hypothetical protein
MMPAANSVVIRKDKKFALLCRLVSFFSRSMALKQLELGTFQHGA